MVLPELRWVQLVSSEGGLGPECVLPLGSAGVEPLVLAGEVEAPVFAEVAVADHRPEGEDGFGAFQDVLPAINAGAYSFEAANARHEHEWEVWRNVKLPDGKVILPGVVTHFTNAVAHPELVAERIVGFAEAVGRENVVASTDCGHGGWVHPQIAWAKLDTLVKGAELATSQLWG